MKLWFAAVASLTAAKMITKNCSGLGCCLFHAFVCLRHEGEASVCVSGRGHGLFVAPHGDRGLGGASLASDAVWGAAAADAVGLFPA